MTLWGHGDTFAPMSKPLKIAAVVLGGVLIASLLEGFATRPPFTLKGQRVLLIGSSSAVGIGRKLKAALDAQGIAAFQNIGVSGSNIRQWADSRTAEGAALDRAIAQFQPSVVFVFVGTNDEALRQGNPNRDVAKLCASAIEQLHTKLALVGTRSFFIGLPPHTLWPMDRNFRTLLATTWGENYFNTEAVNPNKAADGYHLSSRGYDQLLAAMMPWLLAKQR